MNEEFVEHLKKLEEAEIEEGKIERYFYIGVLKALIEIKDELVKMNEILQKKDKY